MSRRLDIDGDCVPPFRLTVSLGSIDFATIASGKVRTVKMFLFNSRPSTTMLLSALPHRSCSQSAGYHSLKCPFTLTSCPALPCTLPAGHQCCVSISFSPEAPGDFFCTMLFEFSSEPKAQELKLTGTAVLPSIPSVISADGSRYAIAFWDHDTTSSCSIHSPSTVRISEGPSNPPQLSGRSDNIQCTHDKSLQRPPSAPDSNRSSTTSPSPRHVRWTGSTESNSNSGVEERLQRLEKLVITSKSQARTFEAPTTPLGIPRSRSGSIAYNSHEEQENKEEDTISSCSDKSLLEMVKTETTYQTPKHWNEFMQGKFSDFYFSRATK